MDFASVLEGVSVVRLDTVEVVTTGKTEAQAGDSVWSFIPQIPWKAGAHELRLTELVADMAGNKLSRRFEVSDPEEFNAGTIPFRWRFTVE